MRTRLLLLLALVLSGGAASAQRPLPTPVAEPLDLIIEGARIVDGTGRPAFAGDVGVLRGRIVALAPAGALRQASASRRIDARGLVLAPGFVDVHSHTVPAILGPERKLNEGVVRQGVTTVLAGPDGGAGPDDIRRLGETGDDRGRGRGRGRGGDD
jgi:adenine deaminase